MKTDSSPAPPDQRLLRILYLEDNARDRELVEERLRSDGVNCKFIRAKSRTEFEAGLAEGPLDLILSDFTLPNYSGEAALAEARRHHAAVPFLFVSGTIGEERAVETLKIGATDYIIKDHLDRLTPAVRRALREAADHNLRRKAEADLRSSEERFRMVFESAPIGVVNSDANCIVLRANRTLQKMLGYSEAELIGISFQDITHEADRGLGKAEIADLLAGKVERVRLEKRYYRKDRSIIWVQLTASAIRDAQGAFQQFVILIEDRTEFKLAEEQMRDQARLLNMARDAILVQDDEGRILSWNQGAERLYGWPEDEALGRIVTEFLYLDPANYDLTKQGLLQDGEWSGELRQLTRAGKVVFVESHATLMRDESGSPKSVLIINTDVTEKKKLEAQFLRAQRMESIGTLAGGIAHDLNNILAPIAIAVQILRMKPEADETDQMLDRIDASARRGADVVRQVLTFARGIEGERVLLQPLHLLKEVVKIAEETFPKSITISYSFNDLWPITGDATQLHQVLLNLCVNARDAMPAGGKLRLSAENIMLADTTHSLLPGAKAGPYVLLQVTDTGTGIAPEIREKIFEPFFTTKELGKGTGLGLSTVLGIIKSHGGSVNVYSEPGLGSTFSIYLPAVPIVLAPESVNGPAQLPRGHGEMVLVVDDEEPIRDVIRRILAQHGYNVMVAVDGADGANVFAGALGKIQLVLTDMMMPRMDGLALIRAIKKLDPNIKVIATSGLAQVPDQADRTQELKSLGVEHYLVKPCSAEKLLLLVNEVLTTHAAVS